jgi:hypothetical protein
MQMDSANLPNQGDLNSLYGAWNPMSYMQGYENQDLASQFRQQAFNANQNTVAKGQIENTLAGATLPYDVAQKQANVDSTLASTDKTRIGNQEAALTLAGNQQNQDQRIAAEAAKFAAGKSASEISLAADTALKNLLKVNGDPNSSPDEINHAREMFQIAAGGANSSAGRMQERQLAELNTMSKAQIAQMERESQERIASAGNVSRERIADTNADARVKAADLHMGLAQQLRQEMAKPRDQWDIAKIDELTRRMQLTLPAVAGGANISALGAGQGLQGNIVPASTPAQGVTSSGAKYTIVPTQ